MITIAPRLLRLAVVTFLAITSSSFLHAAAPDTAFGLLGGKRAIPVLPDQLRNSDNQQLRTDLVHALGWIKSREAISAPEKALTDP